MGNTVSPCVIFTAPAKSGKNVLTCSGINEAGSNVPIEMKMLRLQLVLLLSAKRWWKSVLNFSRKTMDKHKAVERYRIDPSWYQPGRFTNGPVNHLTSMRKENQILDCVTESIICKIKIMPTNYVKPLVALQTWLWSNHFFIS